MAKRKGSATSRPQASNKAAKAAKPKDEREAEEIANARRLDKLPPEVWEKILDHFDRDNQFPLALSCRYFRQKQKELVARMRQSGYKSLFSLKTSLRRKLITKPGESQPTSVKYLRFAKKGGGARYLISDLAAFHGHLPLLRELLISSETRLDPEFEFFDLLTLDLGENAGEFSICSVSSFYTFSLLTRFSPLRSSRRPTGDVAVAENPAGVRVD